MGSNTRFLANLGEIARNAGESTNVTNNLSLQLNQNKNEAMADLKYSCPPLIIFSSKGLIPFTQKHSSWQAPMALPATAYINNAVSSLDCTVRDGEWLAWWKISEIMPESLLWCSSKEYARPPPKNKPRMTLRVPLLLLPSTQHFLPNRIML